MTQEEHIAKLKELGISSTRIEAMSPEAYKSEQDFLSEQDLRRRLEHNQAVLLPLIVRRSIY